jgi:hypothetical protein
MGDFSIVPPLRNPLFFVSQKAGWRSLTAKREGSSVCKALYSCQKTGALHPVAGLTLKHWHAFVSGVLRNI